MNSNQMLEGVDRKEDQAKTDASHSWCLSYLPPHSSQNQFHKMRLLQSFQSLPPPSESIPPFASSAFPPPPHQLRANSADPEPLLDYQTCDSYFGTCSKLACHKYSSRRREAMKQISRIACWSFQLSEDRLPSQEFRKHWRD